MKKKRGLSAIVTTLIVLLLVFVLIAVIWVVVKSLVDRGAEQVNLQAKCLENSVKVTKATCSGLDEMTCDITLSRESGQEELAGVKVVFTDEAEENTHTEDVSGDIAAPGLKTVKLSSGFGNPGKVRAEAYFLSSAGKEQICQGGTEFSIS